MIWKNWENVKVHVGVDQAIQGIPAVVTWKNGHLHVFVRGVNNNIYHGEYKSDAATKWTWEALPVTLPSTTLIYIAAVSWGDDRTDLFATGSDQKIYHCAWNGTINKWDKGWAEVPVIGATSYAPAAASWKNGRFDVFVHTTDNYMSSVHYENGWSSEWKNEGGQGKFLNSAPTAAASGPNRIDCFALETVSRKHLIHTSYDGSSPGPSWTQPGPVDEAHTIAGDPAAASSHSGTGRVDVFARSDTNRLIHREFMADNWTNNWEDLGKVGTDQNITGDPAAAAWWDGVVPKRFDCFALGDSHTLKHAFWVPE